MKQLTDERLEECNDYRFALMCKDEPDKAADAVNDLLEGYKALLSQIEDMQKTMKQIINHQHDVTSRSIIINRVVSAAESSLQSLKEDKPNEKSQL